MTFFIGDRTVIRFGNVMELHLFHILARRLLISAIRV